MHMAGRFVVGDIEADSKYKLSSFRFLLVVLYYIDVLFSATFVG